MSDQVFGTPITDSTLQQLYPGDPVTVRRRAEVAHNYMEADSRSEDARKFVADLKSNYGNGTSTLCTVFNATGSTLTFARFHSWEGAVFRSPYPHIIQNGQWGVFLHVRARLRGPSKEGVVYRGVNANGHTREWVIAWNTSRQNSQNRVYTEISTSLVTSWDRVNSNMDRNLLRHEATTGGCHSTVSVGSGSSPYFRAILSLEGVTRNALGSDVSTTTILPSLDSEYIDQYDDQDDEPADDDDTTHPAATAPAE